MTTITDLIKKAALKEEIYEPKYGGKDHSGYNTMMLYEVNGERYECFEKGANFLLPHVIGFAEWISDESNPNGVRKYANHLYNTKELFTLYLEQLNKHDGEPE